jgi:hypothetical protein
MPRNQKGASAIEFSLILPLLLLVVDGMMEFSMLMYDKVMITHSAREAVRAGVVSSTPKLSTNQISAVATNYCQNYLLSFDTGNNFQVLVAQSADGAYQTPLSVSVTYTYTSLLVGRSMAAIQRPIMLTSIASGFNE